MQLLLVPAVLGLAAFAAGCAGPETLGQQEQRQRLAALDYPAEAEYGPDLDIVVHREDRQLSFINRTARPYVDARIWLNQQFVRELPRIDIGPGNDFALRRWINEHAEGFPVGTLLAPDLAEPVVLAELHDPRSGLRHRLLVWPDETER